MKTAIARRTFRRTDTNQIVHIGKKIEGEDAYIDELVRNRSVRYAEGSTYLTYEDIPLPPVTEITEEPKVVVKKKRKTKTKKKTSK